jgi:hypothetical protein
VTSPPAFLAAAARLVVGLSASVHFHAPAFNPKIPGSWLVDLSHVEVDPRQPSPFTPDGTRPTGPGWYQTHTVAYAQELDYNVAPLEVAARLHNGVETVAAWGLACPGCVAFADRSRCISPGAPGGAPANLLTPSVLADGACLAAGPALWG